MKEHVPVLSEKFEKSCSHRRVNSNTSTVISDISYSDDDTYVGKHNKSETITMINALRKRRSLPPLIISSHLQSKAEEHADQMVIRRQMHSSFRRPSDVLTAVVQDDRYVSSVFRSHKHVFELIECGSDVDVIRERILSNHRCLFLKSSLTHVGLGAARGNDGLVYVCIEFDTTDRKPKQKMKVSISRSERSESDDKSIKLSSRISRRSFSIKRRDSSPSVFSKSRRDDKSNKSEPGSLRKFVSIKRWSSSQHR